MKRAKLKLDGQQHKVKVEDPPGCRGQWQLSCTIDGMVLYGCATSFGMACARLEKAVKIYNAKKKKQQK